MSAATPSDLRRRVRRSAAGESWAQPPILAPTPWSPARLVGPSRRSSTRGADGLEEERTGDDVRAHRVTQAPGYRFYDRLGELLQASDLGRFLGVDASSPATRTTAGDVTCSRWVRASGCS